MTKTQIRSDNDSPSPPRHSNRHLGRWLASTHPLEPSSSPPQPMLLLNHAQEYFDVWATLSPRHRSHDLSPPTSPRLRVGEGEDALPLPLRRQAPPLFVSPESSEGATSSSDGKRKGKGKLASLKQTFRRLSTFPSASPKGDSKVSSSSSGIGSASNTGSHSMDSSRTSDSWRMFGF